MKLVFLGTAFLFLLVVSLGLVIIAGGMLIGLQPDVVMVEDAFVYPEGDAFVMVLERGPYLTLDQRGAGCYRLHEPLTTANYGLAELVWPVCFVKE